MNGWELRALFDGNWDAATLAGGADLNDRTPRTPELVLREIADLRRKRFVFLVIRRTPAPG
jgi:hypothetical protein